MKSRPWGRKTPPASTHRPRRLPHPPRLRLHFRARVHTPPHRLPRPPRSNWPSAAAVIHNRLSTEKLSTSLLAALCKTFSPPRLRTRIYNISFARRLLPGVSAPLWGRGHAVVAPWPAPPSAGWGRAKAKVDAPLHSAPHFPCLRPRTCPPKTAPLPAYGRITVRKGGAHKAIPAPARAFSPRQPAYGRAPVRLWAKCRAFSPRQLVYGRAPARLWAKCRAQRRKCTR